MMEGAIIEVLATIWQLCTTPSVVVSCIVLYIVLLPVYRLTLHPLSSYPGPPLWCISRIPWHLALHSGHLHHRMHQFHEKYGAIVRIAPNELSYAHADAWKDIYSNKAFEKNSIWFRMPAGEPASIMGSDELPHSRLRRAFMGAFADESLKDMSNVVEGYARSMARKLTQLAGMNGGHEIVDLVEWLDFATFDISADLSFGASFGSIENAKGHPWVKISTEFGRFVAMIASLNFLGPLSRILTMISPKGPSRNFDPDAIPSNVGEKFAYHRGLTKWRVSQRLAAGAKKTDFIGSIERYNNEMMEKGNNDKVVTTEELEANMSILVFAGSETTSSALSSTLRYILQNEAVMKKLQKEVRETFNSKHEITATSAAKLEYLTAVINEGLRLGPPIIVGIPRVVPKTGGFICGKPVPGGTFVAINQYAAYRSSFNFSDADSFRPERFTSPDPGDNMALLQAFGTGRHLCIGYKLAWIMMRLILAQMVYTFDMKLINPEAVEDFGQQKSFIFWAKEPLMVRLTTRTAII